jgi:Zn-dependent peptidase ImmA (M78 family)
LGRHHRGDIWISARGELCIRTSKGKKAYHRFVVEEYIGYKLPQELTVHHINGNHSDNSLSNLMIISEELHMLLHKYGIKDKLASNLFLYKKDKIVEEVNRSV